MRQDVTLKAGFGIPSNAVALFPEPVPMLEAMHHVYVQASKCAQRNIQCILYSVHTE